MADPLLVAAAGFVGLQFPVAVLVWLDARRLNLERPGRYPVAIATVLLFGWLVLAAYIERRDELPRADERVSVEAPATEGWNADGRLVYAVDLGGVARFPRRLRYWVAGLSRPVWWAWFVVVPAALLCAILLGFRRLTLLYIWFTLLSWVSVWQLSGWGTDALVTVDPDAAVLCIVPLGGDPTDERSEYGLAELDSARFVDAGEYVTIDCRYETWFLLRPGTLFVPALLADELGAALRACGVTVHGAVGDGETRALSTLTDSTVAWFRSVTTLSALVAGPLVALLL
jgi:hypothetical protein